MDELVTAEALTNLACYLCFNLLATPGEKISNF